jgi:hypothetical protein
MNRASLSRGDTRAGFESATVFFKSQTVVFNFKEGTGLYHCPYRRYKGKGGCFKYIRRHVPLNGVAFALNRGR